MKGRREHPRAMIIMFLSMPTLSKRDITDQQTPLDIGILLEIFHDCTVWKERRDEVNSYKVVMRLEYALKGKEVGVTMIVPDDYLFDQKLLKEY